jgi:hypothetical protein
VISQIPVFQSVFLSKDAIDVFQKFFLKDAIAREMSVGFDDLLCIGVGQ